MALRDMTHSLLSAVDLAIDLATLGEYGLETLPDEAECELTGSGWEALAPARRRGDRCTAGGDAESVGGALAGV
jgi:hypothetical protein